MHTSILVLIAATALPGFSQSNPDLQTFFQKDIGLSQDQIAAIGSGQPVTKTLRSRTPAEVFLFGAVYIHAAPESYIQFARDFDRLRKLPNYLALGVFGTPPELSDLKGFSFESDDVQALKNCKPGDCLIQMPASSIEQFRQSINWSADDAQSYLRTGSVPRALDHFLCRGHPGSYPDPRATIRRRTPLPLLSRRRASNRRMALTGPDDDLSPGWLAHASGRLIMNRTGGFHQVSRIVKARTPTQAPNESLVAVYLSYLDRLVLTTLTAPVSLYSPDPFSIMRTPTRGNTLDCGPAMSHCEIQSP